MNRLLFCCAAAACFLGGNVSSADVFGSGANSFDIDFVTIGNPGNPPDTTGNPNPAGAVPYEYRIGKYEISEQMIDKANALGGLGIMKEARGPDKPAMVRWFDAAKFVNWLNTGTGSMPAYKFGAGGSFQLWQPIDPGYDPKNLYRNKLATYFMPSVDEWYKAAYYDQTTGTYFDYPTGSNNPPTAVASGTVPGTAVYKSGFAAGPADIMLAGGLSPYGTMAQGGNVDEWEETEFDLINDSLFGDRGVRGGYWNSNADGSSALTRYRGRLFSPAGLTTGLRVGSIVAEPSAVLPFGLGLLASLGFAQRLSLLRRCASASVCYATLAIAVMLSVAAFVGPAKAGVIYSQVGPSPPIGAFSSNDAGNPTDQKIADNFLFNSPGSATVRSLRFIGGYGLTNPPPSTPPLNVLPTDNFRVVFLADNAGAPGLPIPGGDFHLGAPVQRTPTSGPLLNGVDTPIEYKLDLGAGISVNPSNVYWVSIVNNPGTNYFWDWARTAGVFDQRVASTYGDISSGTWDVGTNEGGMFFELSDQNVPEPTSLLILLMAAGVMFWLCVMHRSRS